MEFSDGSLKGLIGWFVLIAVVMAETPSFYRLATGQEDENVWKWGELLGDVL